MDKVFEQNKKKVLDFLKAEKEEKRQVEIAGLLKMSHGEVRSFLYRLTNCIPQIYETDKGRIGLAPYTYNEN